MMKRTLAILVLSLTAGSTRGSDHAPRRVAGEELVGTWTLVSVDNVLADGRRIQPYGPRPDGILTFDSGGRYSISIFRPDRAPFASNDKSRGTAEENQATVQGTNSHFGRYKVDVEKGVLTFHIDHASFPNWERTVQNRSFVLKDDILRYTVQTTTTGGTEVGEIAWKRPGA